MTRAVLVNGVPASGKSTLARALAARLEVPILELDVIKEVLFEELGHRNADRTWGRALGRASLESIWALLAGFPGDSTVVVEAWFRLPPHDHVVRGLERAGIDRWVEIWCHADTEVLVARYSRRARHPGHPAAEDYLEELKELAAVARPMDLSPCLSVDTGASSTLDLERVVRWVRHELRMRPHVARPST